MPNNAQMFLWSLKRVLPLKMEKNIASHAAIFLKRKINSKNIKETAQETLKAKTWLRVYHWD
jgi:hypothetical protein